MFGANAVRAFRTFSAKLVKANPLLHCTCEDFNLFSSLFSLCWDQSLAWAIPPSKEQLKGQEPAGISPFSFQTANTAGAPQMWARDAKLWTGFICFFFFIKIWRLLAHWSQAGGGGCNSILSFYLELDCFSAVDLWLSLGVFRERMTELVDSLSKKYLKLLIIVIIVVTKLLWFQWYCFSVLPQFSLIGIRMLLTLKHTCTLVHCGDFAFPLKPMQITDRCN